VCEIKKELTEGIFEGGNPIAFAMCSVCSSKSAIIISMGSLINPSGVSIATLSISTPPIFVVQNKQKRK
jgi:hypothetical protein